MKDILFNVLNKVYPCFFLRDETLDPLVEDEVFLVVDFKDDYSGSFGENIEFDILIYAPLNAPALLDKAINKVSSLIHKRRFKGSSSNTFFYTKWTGRGFMFNDDLNKYWVQSLSFNALRLG